MTKTTAIMIIVLSCACRKTPDGRPPAPLGRIDWQRPADWSCGHKTRIEAFCWTGNVWQADECLYSQPLLGLSCPPEGWTIMTSPSDDRIDRICFTGAKPESILGFMRVVIGGHIDEGLAHALERTYREHLSWPDQSPYWVSDTDLGAGGRELCWGMGVAKDEHALKQARALGAFKSR